MTALRAGETAQARQLLDEAAAVYLSRNDLAGAASAKAFASQLCRLAGDLEGADGRAAEAADEARRSGDARSLAAAYTALGEAQLSRGAVAFAALSLGLATRFEVEPVRLARLYRRRGAALWASAAPRSAGWSLATSARLYGEAGDVHTSLSVLLERAAALAGTDAATAAEARRVAQDAAITAGRPDVLVDLNLLGAARALDEGDQEAAWAQLIGARAEALREVDPLRYVVAQQALSTIAETRGDDVEAYRQLAIGWVTLTDLLGRETARQAFRPSLLQLRERWGTPRFDAAKQQYEAQRSAQSNRSDHA